MTFSQTGRRPRLAWLALTAFIVLIAFTGCKKKTPEEQFQEIQQLLQERQPSLAILKMRELIEKNPDAPITPNVRMTLADVYMQLDPQNNLNKALDQLIAVYESEGVESNAGMSAHGAIVEVYRQTGQMDKALAQVADSIVKSEGNPDLNSQMLLMQARLQLGSGDETLQQTARDFLDEQMVTSEDPAFRGAAREMMAQYLRQTGDFEGSNRVYTTYLETFPEDPIKPQLLMAIGINDKDAGNEDEGKKRFAEGVEALNAVIEEELDLTRRTEMLQQLATFQQRFGDLDAAEASMKRIMAENPRTQTALATQFAIARMFALEGHYEKAQETYDRILKDNAGTPIEQMAIDEMKQLDELRAQIEASSNAATETAAPDSAQEATPAEPATEAAP